MTILNVGVGQQYATLAAAVAASHDGDTIDVQAGTYTNDFATLTHQVTIESVGGMANFVATVAPPNGKAILTTDASATIKGLSFSGAAVADANGAGIRQEAGSLTVEDCYFHNNQMGILTANSASLSLTVLNSEFGGAFTTAGHLSHQIYAGQIGSFDIENCLFLDSGNGHQIKSRAAVSVIKDNVIDDGNGITSYDIDLPNGGAATVTGNTIVKGVHDPNTTVISYGEEGMFWSSKPNSLTVDHNIIDNHLTSGGIGVNNHSTVLAHIDNNEFYHLPTVAVGANEQTTNTVLTTEPSVDLTPPFQTGGSTGGGGTGGTAPAPFVLPVSGAAQHTIYGTSGNDNIVGTAQNDFIDPWGGVDTMAGGKGDDTYWINNSADIIIENPGEGIDTAMQKVAQYTLANNVENLTLVGNFAHISNGNGLNNLITASATGNDTINAGAGNDIIKAGGGVDTLTGGPGNDMFVFSMVGKGSTVTDFTVGEDLLDLRPLMTAIGHSGDPIADHTVTLVANAAGGTDVMVDPTHSGTAQKLVTLDHVAPMQLHAGGSGSDILWH